MHTFCTPARFLAIKNNRKALILQGFPVSGLKPKKGFFLFFFKYENV
nr:MAG TPA: hypothetical protein [Caudoviricetes sp.]